MNVVRIGLRELRGGLAGFRLFIACIALGVTVIAAVGTLADSLRTAFADQGATLLGGDVTFSRMHLRASETERGVIATLGRTSETATLRSMARRTDGEDQVLAELKGVDNAYPLAGRVVLDGGQNFATALQGRSAVADGLLLDRLGLRVGDKLKIGDAEIQVQGILRSEPDAIADRLSYGPRVFVSLDTLQATGLIQPGSLVRWRYAIDLPKAAQKDQTSLDALKKDVALRLPESGFSSADRNDPSPQITKTLERLRQFLILAGLASLLVGGAGVANAVQTFIAKRTKVIALLRSTGATANQILSIFLVQILAMTALGIVIGLVAGGLLPLVLQKLLSGSLPVEAHFALSLRSAATAAGYGILTALLFALIPLGRAEQIKANELFRSSIAPARGWPSLRIAAAVAAVAAALLGAALISSDTPRIAAGFAAAVIVNLVLFAGLGALVTRLARRAPRIPFLPLSLAVRSIGAPGGLTGSVILSLGTGLSLLVALALINASVTSELSGRLPERSPDYFLLDIPKSSYQDLAKFVTARVPGASVEQAPMLRGRLVKLNGQPVETIKPPADAQWVLTGERGLTYAATLPEGSKLTKGDWWPADYAGPPLVSFDGALARSLGLGIGDSVTVNVLGKNVEAKIANFREVNWGSLAINFVMVFSPNTLVGAPHTILSTVRLPVGVESGQEAALVRDLGQSYPAVSAIRVKDALEQAGKIVAKVLTAIQLAGSVTLAAGALSLAGAMTTAQQRRTLDAMILKVLGARRAQILFAHVCEYGLLSLAAALLAAALGTISAIIVVTKVMEIEFVFTPWVIVQTVLVAAALIAAFGALATGSVLKTAPVRVLRRE